MIHCLKQSTAATIKLGPFLDDGDGKTAETGLSIAQADIRITKNGGDCAQSHNSAGATHDENGYYDVPLDASDTDTLGRLRVMVSKSGALPVWDDFSVITANVYDSFFAADFLQVDVEQWLNATAPAAPPTAAALTNVHDDLAALATLHANMQTDLTAVKLHQAMREGVIVFDGGSNTGGMHCSAGMSPAAQASRRVTVPHRLFNHWEAGRYIADFIADAPTDVDPYYDAAAQFNVLICTMGNITMQQNYLTLHMSTADNAADCIAQMKTYVAARQAVGWKCYLLSQQPFHVEVLQEVVDLINATVRADDSWIDGFIDYSSDPHIGLHSAVDPTCDPEYMYDVAHVNDGGAAVMAGYIYDDIRERVDAPTTPADLDDKMDAVKAVTDAIGGYQIVITSAVDDDGEVEVDQGDDVASDLGNLISFTISTGAILSKDWAGATAALYFGDYTVTGAITGTSTKVIAFPAAHASTELWEAKSYDYQAKVTFADAKVKTIARGEILVREDLAD